MSQLDEESVRFARRHIERFYDTDFFPKHFAFEAMWNNWEEAEKLLLSRQVRELPMVTPRSITWPKVRGGYRIVHQLDPISAIAYVAIVHKVAAAIEKVRAPISENVACSYRVALSDGSFFAANNGYTEYRDQSEKLAKLHSHVLLADIADYYNQIYVHRVRNAISTADVALDRYADDLEEMLLRWNSRTSQGIPVGPAPSIVLSEAVLIDVDRFLTRQGVTHTRYVDDFRIFGDSQVALQDVLRKLTAYLYETHRLNLAGEKTRTMTSAEFIAGELESYYETEKIEIFQVIREKLSQYTHETEDVEVDEQAGRDDAIKALDKLLDKVLGRTRLDISLARAVVRRCKHLNVHELVPKVLDHLSQLLPVANDVFLYVEGIWGAYPDDDCLDALERVVDSPAAQEPGVRVWMEWLLTQGRGYVDRAKLVAYVRQSTSMHANARLAIIQSDVAWVREHKTKFWELAPEGRLAVLYASPVLAKDEREPWLRGLLKNDGMTILEKWMANSALRDQLDHSFADTEVPF